MKAWAVLLASTAYALTSSVTSPAFADTSGTTPMKLTITGGVLAISVPSSQVDLGSRANTVNGGIINGRLGQVQVTDARSAAAGSGWVASVVSSAFTPPSGATIGAANIGYTAGDIAKTGTATYTANNPRDLTGAVPAVTATGITGDNSATWNPTINVAVAGGTLANSYTAVITHSLL